VTSGRALRPGDPHPRAYVGPPGEFDYIGGSQFALLLSLGLREWHSVLDFGCGSLRLGRLLIPYLAKDRYFGIEPNRWLVDSAIEEDLGPELIARRRPRFDDNPQFRFDVFGATFDYIVMQSILSHTGADLLHLALANAIHAMARNSLMVATVIHDDTGGVMPDGRMVEGWVYPGCVWFPTEYFRRTAGDYGYAVQPLPWFHPRQSWWLLTRSSDNLLDEPERRALIGYPLRTRT
jgi:SAM-dependent methyltransferase